MKTLLPLLLLAALCACSPDEATVPDGPACSGDACETPECPAPEAPAGCPDARVVDSVDLATGCPALACGPCPQVEIPPCDGGMLKAERDALTECPIAWRCEACETPEVPACPGGRPVAGTDPASGCPTWTCEACPAVEPAACADAVEVVDPATGCTAAWNCPGCADEEPPSCDTGAPIAETGEDGCVTWTCPPCPEVEKPSCPGATPTTDPATGCTTGWRCPGDRWAPVEGLSGTALEEALRGMISGHTALSYDDARDEIFSSIDVVNGVIECIYTGRTTRPDGTRTPGDFNTEHSWPQSDGADVAPRRSDLHHLFPADATANSRRGNLDFGDTACAGSSCKWNGGGSELGPPPGGGGDVFEVRMAYRGDIARAHFYFAVRYGLSISRSEETVLRRWNDEDPPSERERARNDAIEAIQHNRNPFVDRPDFVDRIGDF